MVVYLFKYDMKDFDYLYVSLKVLNIKEQGIMLFV